MIDQLKNQMQAEEYSISTINTYAKQVEYYFKFCKDEGIELEDITSIKKYVELSKQKFKPSTTNQAVRAVKYYFNKVKGLDLKFEGVKVPRLHRDFPSILSRNEVKVILHNTNNYKYFTILSLVYGLGLDSGEVIEIKLKDIFWDDRYILIKARVGHPARKAPFGRYLDKILKDYISEYKPTNHLFYGKKKIKQFSKRTVQSLFKKAIRKSGLSDDYTVKSLKYAYVMHLNDEGIDMVNILKHLEIFSGQSLAFYSLINEKKVDIDYTPFEFEEDDDKKPEIKFNISDRQVSNIDLSHDQLELFVEKYQSTIQEVLKYNIQNEDIKNLGYRKEQLDKFNDLLTNDEVFINSKRGYEIIWQNYFEKNLWIFGYGLNFLFMSTLDNKKLEQVVSGFNFNDYGKRIDGLLKTNGFISSLCFVEIKTHKTKLINHNSYRVESYSISSELSGAISQVQRTVQKTLSNLKTKIEIKNKEGYLTNENIYLYKPKAFIIIGHMDEFEGEYGINEDKYSSFEMFRQSLKDIEIITFDELYERSKFIVEKN